MGLPKWSPISIKSKVRLTELYNLWQEIKHFSILIRLQSGWSVKTAIMNHCKQPEPISAEEHEKIRQVVEKAEALEKAEEERLG